MSYEWHANFALKRQDLQNVVEGRGRFQVVGDLYARLQLLAQSLEDQRWNTEAKSHIVREKRPGGKVEIPRTYLRLTMTYHDRPSETWYTAEHIKPCLETYAPLGFATPRLTETDLACLPEHSFFLYVPFTLAAPYISQDDEPFYVHENPVRKDHVIRVPIVGSTSWKGSFRAALRWTLRVSDEDPLVVRLLGNPKGEGENFRRGRLSFYPTFFDALEVQVINPHLRETGAGDKPIHIEGVPRGAKGAFALLYTPITPNEPKPNVPLPTWEDVLKDLEHVGRATYTLLAETGFGAKTSSGMGRAEDDIPGAYLLIHRWVETTPTLPPPPPGERPPERFQPDDDEFLDEEGNWPYYETNEKMEAHITGNAARRRYRKQRMAYRRWLREREPWAEWEQQVARLREQVERRMLHLDLKHLEEVKRLRERVENVGKGGGDE